MDIDGIIWLEDVVDKLASKHRVSTDEVEQALTSKPKFRFLEKGERRGEDVYVALGRTERRSVPYRVVHLEADQGGLGLECP